MKKRIYKQKDMTANPGKYLQKYFKFKPCRWCEKEFQPVAPSHLFCSDKCKDTSYTDSYFKQKYGISFAEVNEMLKNQNHRCAICGGEGFKMVKGAWSNFALDHCHESNKPRGLLCHNCNRGLGLFHDKIEHLKNAITYLESATTIPEGSTPKQVEARDTQKSDDIVWSMQECIAAEKRDENSELI